MKKRVGFLIAIVNIFLWSSCLITQQAKTGDMLFDEKKYTQAADLLKSEFNKEQDPAIRGKKAFTIGDCYRLSGQPLDAEQWYKTASDLGDDSRAKYMYALMLKTNEKYEEAVKEFNLYLKESPFDEEAKSEVEASNLALEWKKADSRVTVLPVDGLNSIAFDYAPTLYSKNGIVFTSDRADAAGSETYGWTGEKFSDLYVAYKDASGKFGSPVPFSDKINSPFNEGAASFSRDFTECYFTRCGSTQTVNDYCHIFYTYRNGDDWSDPVEVYILNDSCNVVQPFLSADGKELYVSSDVDGGYGGKDIYVLTKNQDGTWANALNLGPNINTAGDEVFPQLASDGKLYFSSNGQEGMGGLDNFSATKINKQWNNVQNLRSPVNSGADDFSMVFEKVKPEDQYKIKAQGYFVSNRPGGKGKDDIYFFSEEKTKVFLVRGDVTEKKFVNADDPNSAVAGFSSMPLTAVTLAPSDEGGNPLGPSKTIKSDAKGRFQFVVESDKTYKVSASKADYFTRSETASTMDFRKQDKDTVIATVRLVLDKIYKNVQVNISNIYYDYNKANIRPDAAVVLDTVVNILKENPNVKVEIGSHTDSRGKDAYNLRLSQARAQSVVDYLVAHGIDASKLSAKGYGETQPVNKCVNGVNCTDEEFQANRRTTFKVTAAEFSLESAAPEKIVQDSTMIKK